MIDGLSQRVVVVEIVGRNPGLGDLDLKILQLTQDLLQYLSVIAAQHYRVDVLEFLVGAVDDQIGVKAPISGYELIQGKK